MTKTSRVNNEPIRALAERMYVEEGMTAKAIAETVGVTEQTVGRWKKGVGKMSRDWDQLRKDFLAAPGNVRKILMDELTSLSQGDKSKLDLKAIKECVTIIDSLTDSVSVQVVMTVFKEFDTWMSSQDPETAVLFLEFHKLFLLHKAQNEQ
ncbi:MAG: DUF1804 family protein [Chitinophagaceae bacterium]|nr:DUF1804 family protein [Chitinophagaceae bacterium]